MSLDVAKRREQGNGGDVETAVILRRTFEFSNERFGNALSFFKSEKVERAMVKALVEHMPLDINGMLRDKSALLVPDDAVKGPYRHLAEMLGYQVVPIREVLEGVRGHTISIGAVKFELSPEAIYFLASGEDIPLGGLAAGRDSKTAGAGISLSPFKAGGRVEKESTFQAASEVVLEKRHLPLLLLPAFSKLAKQRGGILGRRRPLVSLAPLETQHLGPAALKTVSGDGFEDVKLAFTFPPREGADEFYDIIASERVLSPFFTAAQQGVKGGIVRAVHAAVYNKEVLRMMPDGLRKLVEALNDRAYLHEIVRETTRMVGYNPILAMKAVCASISLTYGYMNRRADKLDAMMMELRRRGDYKHYQLAGRLERTFRELATNVFPALGLAVGPSLRIGSLMLSDEASYFAFLREFVAGLSNEKASKLYRTLTKAEADADAMKVLLKIGAVNITEPGADFEPTYIGHLVRGLLEERLIGRESAWRGSGLLWKRLTLPDPHRTVKVVFSDSYKGYYGVGEHRQLVDSGRALQDLEAGEAAE